MYLSATSIELSEFLARESVAELMEYLDEDKAKIQQY